MFYFEKLSKRGQFKYLGKNYSYTGKVFYKNKFKDKYIGGITYSGTIPALEKDEKIVLNSVHYFKDSSEVMFVTYAE